MMNDGLLEQFVEWQCAERRMLFDAMRSGSTPRFLGAHLPVLSTFNGADAPFPVHSCTKGVGLLPRPEYLEHQLAEVRECADACRHSPPARTRERRIEAALSLYGHPNRIDRQVLGAIEIFHGRARSNLARDGRATLLFTGEGPTYPSYMVTCTTLLVDGDSPYFLFLRGMRMLFEAESFHIRQPVYSAGYVFRVWECVEKTPRRLSRSPVACGGHR